MNARYIFFGLAITITTPALPQTATNGASTVKKTVATTPQSQHEDEGKRVFEQNCSRCHNTPDGFSPRISGTVTRHMRVRASLSKHDEQELLRFLNP